MFKYESVAKICFFFKVQIFQGSDTEGYSRR